MRPYLLILAAMAPAAYAQDGCSTVNGYTVCSGGSGSSLGMEAQPLDVRGAYRRQEEARQQREAIIREQREAAARQQALVADIKAAREADAATRKRVGLLVAAGDCVTAERIALEMGDLELARQSRDYCSSARCPPAAAAAEPETPLGD